MRSQNAANAISGIQILIFFLGGDAPKPPYKSRAFDSRPPPPPFPKVSATVNDVMKQCISFKNSLIIHEENTKKNHKRVVSLYVDKDFPSFT
jgi:hypothetical protein